MVLSRKTREAVVVLDFGVLEPKVTITVLQIESGRVRLGFQADSAVAVHRWEVWQRIQVNGRPDSPTADAAAPSKGR